MSSRKLTLLAMDSPKDDAATINLTFSRPLTFLERAGLETLINRELKLGAPK